MNIKTSDGIELYMEQSGDGFPCIYLHGGPGYWSKSFTYFSQGLLEKDLEMIYLDQRGCGRSAHDIDENYSLDRLVEDIEEVRKQLEIEEWYVMGHSFGGIFAVNYANQYPERTKGIILINATLNMIESFSHQINKGLEILKREEVTVPTEDLTSLINLFYAIHGELHNNDEFVKYQFAELENKLKLDQLDDDDELNTSPSFQNYIFTSDEYFQDFTLLANSIDLPVLILTGLYDDAVGPNHYQTFGFHNSHVSVIDGAHHPYLENPDEFKNAILEFVKKD